MLAGPAVTHDGATAGLGLFQLVGQKIPTGSQTQQIGPGLAIGGNARPLQGVLGQLPVLSKALPQGQQIGTRIHGLLANPHRVRKMCDPVLFRVRWNIKG